MKQITVLFSGRKQAAYLLDEAHVVIGRGRSAHIALDGNPIVSRQHAVIREELGEHLIEDLGGANGTFGNDAKINRVRLREGDRIVLGKHTLRFELATPEAVSVRRGQSQSSGSEDDVATRAMETVQEELPSSRGGMSSGTRPGSSSPPPWTVGGASGAAAPGPTMGSLSPMGQGSERTFAASKEELESLLEQMKLKAGPHLSIRRGGQLNLLPLTDPPVHVGHTDACMVRLEGTKWFGRLAATLNVERGTWWLYARSSFWNPVHIGNSKVLKKRRLRTGDTISVGKLKFRFSMGDQE